MTKRILCALALLTGPALSAPAQESGWIGISIAEQPDRGALVRSVEPNSPAERAGFKQGDVVVEFNKEPVIGVQQLTRLIREMPSGRTVDVKILRDGREQTLRVTTDSYPWQYGRIPLPPIQLDIDRVIRQIPRVEVNTVHVQDGIRVEQMTDQLRDFFGVFSNSGVLVTSVASNSIAERAGLKAGDVITAVDGKNIRTPADFSRELRSSSKPALKVIRDKQEREIRIE
jgi:serine protease Do